MWWITPETLEQSDEALGWELLQRLIFYFAQRRGIAVSDVTEDIAKSEFLKLAAMDSDNAEIAGLEKAYKRAIGGDIARGGRLFRAYLRNIAETGVYKNLAADTIKTRRRFSEGRKKANSARRKYDDATVKRWRQLANEPNLARIVSKRRRAELIARGEGLPSAAVETIRKLI